MLDGHARFDTNDYKLRLNLSKQQLGYIEVGFDEFRTWYDGNGGFFPGGNTLWIPPAHPEDELDRGEAWIELGLRMPKLPEVTLRYHTSFVMARRIPPPGVIHFTGIPFATRNIAPAIETSMRTRDILS